MDGFNFMVFLSCEKPCEYSRVGACESWSGRIQAYFMKEKRSKAHRDCEIIIGGNLEIKKQLYCSFHATEINEILAFIPVDLG